jgi:phosphoribosyl-ATP pyrophosphohydrolase
MQKDELKARLADTLWYLAILCTETGLAMTDVAAHSLAQLEARRNALDPDQR